MSSSWKSILTALSFTLFLAGRSTAQLLSAAKVPAEVRTAQQARFAGITKVEWKLKTDQNYEAEFKSKGVDVAVKYAPGGSWLETETTIKRASLPEAVQVTIKRDFKGYRQIETQRLERAEAPPLLYEVHLDNGKEVVKLQVDPAGAVTSKSAKVKVAKAAK